MKWLQNGKLRQFLEQEEGGETLAWLHWCLGRFFLFCLILLVLLSPWQYSSYEVDNVLSPGVVGLTRLRSRRRESKGLNLNLWLQEVISTSILIQVIHCISNLDFRLSKVKMSHIVLPEFILFLGEKIIFNLKYNYIIFLFPLLSLPCATKTLPKCAAF